MKKTKVLLTCVVLAVLFFASFSSLLVFATTVPSFTLSAESLQIWYNLPQGTIFNGTISTTGTIRFWVNAPDNAPIVNLGLIDNNDSFGFAAPQNGSYTFNFENDLPSSVQVTFSYETNPDISGGNSATPSSYYPLATIIVVAVVGSIVIVFAIRRRHRKSSSNALDTSTVQP